MLDDQGGIIERLQNGTLTTNDIQQLIQELQRNANAGVSQLGKTNVSGGSIQDFQVGDRHYHNGITLESIRSLRQELLALQGDQQLALSSSASNVAEQTAQDTPFDELLFDTNTFNLMNQRMEILAELEKGNYLSAIHKQEFQTLKQQLLQVHQFQLKQKLRQLMKASDRLIQDAVADMQLQLHTYKLAGRELTNEIQEQVLPDKSNCQLVESQFFQTFLNDLENSRIGEAWILQNESLLVNYASKIIYKNFPELRNSSKEMDDFRFSLKQFLEQICFCLYWGDYSILDCPDIPLILSHEQYEAAFHAMKAAISKRLSKEVIQAIELCFDYLLERLYTY